DLLEREGGTGALVAEAKPGAAFESVILEDLPGEEGAGERPNSAQGGQLRLQADHIDGQEFGLVLVLHGSYSPVAEACSWPWEARSRPKRWVWSRSRATGAR